MAWGGRESAQSGVALAGECSVAASPGWLLWLLTTKGFGVVWGSRCGKWLLGRGVGDSCKGVWLSETGPNPSILIAGWLDRVALASSM